MAYEDVVPYRDAFADERVARNLAAPAHFCIFLDLDECADLRFAADLASVQIDEFPERHAPPEPYIGRNRLVLFEKRVLGLRHDVNTRPFLRSPPVVSRGGS